jgi:hypothetical protein
MSRDSTPALVLLTAFAVLFGLAWRLGPPPIKAAVADHAQPTYQIAAELTLTGIVQGKPRVHRATAPVVVTLRTSRQPVDLVLAPACYMAEVGLTLVKGDNILVIGAKGLFNDEDVVFVREVTRGTRTVALRDASGVPVW